MNIRNYKDPERQKELSRQRSIRRRQRLGLTWGTIIPWRLKNPFNQCVSRARKSAKKYGAISTLTVAEWESRVKERKFKCWSCGIETCFESHRNNTLSLDHVIPFAKGGQNSIDNIEPSCVQCNMHRKSMLVAEFKAWITRVYLHSCSSDYVIPL